MPNLAKSLGFAGEGILEGIELRGGQYLSGPADVFPKLLASMERLQPARSDALENFRASRPCHAAARSEICRDPSGGNRRRADKASGPDRRRSAIGRPVSRGLEHDPRASNSPYQIIGNPRTGARGTADEDSREISRSRLDRQNRASRPADPAKRRETSLAPKTQQQMREEETEPR